MGPKIYVGGLPSSITDSQLQELFAPYGNVQSARVIIDRATGQSKGFGFVEMATPDEARKAILALNSAELGGRTLNVSEARPQEPRTGGGGGGGYRGGRPGGGGGGGRRDSRW
jgi:RNA recognition motif-containing protein